MAGALAVRAAVALLVMLLSITGEALRTGHGSAVAVVAGARQSPNQLMAAEGADAPAEDEAQEEEEEKPAKLHLKDEQMTWVYWQPAVLSMGFLLLMTELVSPIIDACFAHFLAKEAILFLFTMLGFASVVFATLDPNAAGMNILVAVAVLGSAFAFLFAVFSFSILAFSRNPKDPIKLILTDLAECLRGVVRLIMLVTMEDIISHEAGVDWGRLALVLGFLLIALALALAGVVGDILAHFFIRFDQHFNEGDFILFEGDLVQIEYVKWRHTVALSVPKEAVIYIPNNALTASALINQTTDVSDKVKQMVEDLKKLNLKEG